MVEISSDAIPRSHFRALKAFIVANPRHDMDNSQSVLRHAELNNPEEREHAFEFRVARGGVLTITSNSGIVLNDFLPSWVRMFDAPDTKFSKATESNRVLVDAAYLQKAGKAGASVLAHEIGHVLNPQHKVHTNLIWSLFSVAGSQPDPDQRFWIGLQYSNMRLQAEVEAWNLGLATGVVLGLTVEEYESTMQTCLLSYKKQMGRYLDNMMKHVTTPELWRVQLYNPSLQEYELASLDRVREFFKEVQRSTFDNPLEAE